MAFAAKNLVSDIALNEIQTLQVPNGGTRTFTLTVRDRKTGQPVSVATSGTRLIKLTSAYFWGGDEVVFSVECDVLNETDAANGVVQATLTSSNTSIAGIFTATLSVFIDDLLIHTQPYYIEIEPVDLYRSVGVPTVAEIRLHLRDNAPESNFLLDETEWSDSEIASCIRMPIDMFNELPPPITGYATVDTFPYRYHWMMCTIGYLHRIAAAHYRRNRLAYSAGGITVDPEADKSKEYEMIAKERIQEFKEWAIGKRTELNIAGGWGIIDSSYSSPYLTGGFD